MRKNTNERCHVQGLNNNTKDVCQLMNFITILELQISPRSNITVFSLLIHDHDNGSNNCMLPLIQI